MAGECPPKGRSSLLHAVGPEWLEMTPYIRKHSHSPKSLKRSV